MAPARPGPGTGWRRGSSARTGQDLHGAGLDAGQHGTEGGHELVGFEGGGQLDYQAFALGEGQGAVDDVELGGVDPGHQIRGARDAAAQRQRRRLDGGGGQRLHPGQVVVGAGQGAEQVGGAPGGAQPVAAGGVEAEVGPHALEAFDQGVAPPGARSAAARASSMPARSTVKPES